MPPQHPAIPAPIPSRHPRFRHQPVATLFATDAFRQRLDQMPGLGKDLAEHLGWSPQLISNIKQGRRGVRPEDAPALAAFLGQPVDVLFTTGVVQKPEPLSPVVVAAPDPIRAPADLVALVESLPLTLTASALADLLGVSAATIYERVRDGTIRRVPLGGKRPPVRIPRSEVVRLLTGAKRAGIVAVHLPAWLAVHSKTPAPLATADAGLGIGTRGFQRW